MKRKTLMVSGIILGVLIMVTGIFYIEFLKTINSQMEKIKAGSTILETKEGTIEYAISGKGEPVLMIHGAGGGYDQGLLLSDMLLPRDLMVIAISRFGYLNTPLIDEPTPDNQVKLYIALLDELKLETVHVVGVSDGGPSALKMSINYPERVKSLSLVAAKSKTPPSLTSAQSMAFGTIFNSDFLFWSITKLLQDELYAVLGVSKDVQNKLTEQEAVLAKEFLQQMHPISMRKNGIFNANVQFKELRPEDYPIWKIKAPTLVVHAEDDTLQPFYYAEYAHENIEKSKLLSFKTGGHMLFGHHQDIRDAFTEFYAMR